MGAHDNIEMSGLVQPALESAGVTPDYTPVVTHRSSPVPVEAGGVPGISYFDHEGNEQIMTWEEASRQDNGFAPASGLPSAELNLRSGGLRASFAVDGASAADQHMFWGLAQDLANRGSIGVGGGAGPLTGHSGAYTDPHAYRQPHSPTGGITVEHPGGTPKVSRGHQAVDAIRRATAMREGLGNNSLARRGIGLLSTYAILGTLVAGFSTVESVPFSDNGYAFGFHAKDLPHDGEAIVVSPVVGTKAALGNIAGVMKMVGGL